ncbi:MAG: ABC transporter ATP-binding protein [Planctomycetota bacterium]|jgi:putative ABC transport system ATP-binding protein
MDPKGKAPAPDRQFYSDVLISIRGLDKEFHRGDTVVHALTDVNLDIYEGEYISIMGPSGSGKSTLFNMIGALDRPSSGMVRVAAIDLTKLSSRELAYFRGNHIGYVFQAYNLIPSYTAVDNVVLPLLFCAWEYDEAIARAKEVLTEVGLDHRLDHRPDELSGGQQQRVAIARALANDPAIVLADEPTANLDLQTGEEIIQILGRLSKERGVTVVTATHDHKMLATSDRIIMLRDGRIVEVQLRSDVDIRLGSVR